MKWNVDQVYSGNRLAIARLMHGLEDDLPGARACMTELFPHTGKATVIGVTGSPGTGKSTLVDHLIEVYRSRRKKVGVVAVDPSSSINGGAILGDRIRMLRHAEDEDVFIRSVATRGQLGGLSRCTADMVDLLDAAGVDIVIVETVGVGQGEVDIASLAHLTIVVEVPGLGDDIQAMKAGVLEVADLFIINKADLDGIEAAERSLQSMLATAHSVATDVRIPEIVRTCGRTAQGIVELAAAIDRLLERLDGDLAAKRLRQRMEKRFKEEFLIKLRANALTRLEQHPSHAQILDALCTRKIDPDSAASLAVSAVLQDE